MTLKAGQRAPQFRLYSSELKETSLSDYDGKRLVIHFFSMAFLGVCTNQLCTIRDSYGFYESRNTALVAISIDSPFSLAKFKEENQFQFPLLSDFNKEVCAMYGAFCEEFVFGFKGVSKRAAFVIDEEGKIVYGEVVEGAGDLPDFESIQRAVDLMDSELKQS